MCDKIVFQKESESLLMKNIIIASIMLICGNVISSYILFAALAYILYLFSIKSDEENYYLGLFFIPNIRIFDNLGVTYIVNVLLSIPLMIYIIRKKGRLDNFVLYGWIFFLFWELIHIVYFENYSNFPNEISTLLGMLYCVYITLNECKKLNYKRAWIFFTYGIVFSGVSYLLVDISYFNNVVSKIIAGYRFTGYAGEPNYYSLYICLALSSIFLFRKYSIFDYVTMCILIAFGLMTASKMCALLMLFSLIVGGVDSIKNIKYDSKKKLFFYGFFFLFIGGILFKDQIVMFVQNLINRADLSKGSVDVEHITSGRSSILLTYLSILSSDYLSLILGKGFQYHLFYTCGAGAHNTYLDAILAWGIIGSIGLIFFIGTWGIKFNSQLGNKNFFSIPAIVLAINFFDLSCLSATMFWWILSFTLLTLAKDKNDL